MNAYESDLIDLESLIQEKPPEKKKLFEIQFSEKDIPCLTLKDILSLGLRCNDEYLMMGDWFRGFKLMYQWLGPYLPQSKIYHPVHYRFVTWEFQQLAVILGIRYCVVHRIAEEILG